MSEYSKDAIDKDLAMLVMAGLLDMTMGDDGQWFYSMTEEAKKMTDEERIAALQSLFDREDDIIQKMLES